MSTQSPDPLSPVATVYDAMGERPAGHYQHRRESGMNTTDKLAEALRAAEGLIYNCMGEADGVCEQVAAALAEYDAMGERPRASAQPVDVLAVLDRALMLVNDDDDHDGQPFDTDKSAEVYAGLAQARAAVAELVEAAKEVRAFLTHDQWGSYHYMEGSEVYGELREHAERLRAALARVQGGAA